MAKTSKYAGLFEQTVINDNISQIWNNAIVSGADLDSDWYREVREMVSEIAAFYGLKIRVVAGVVAALSPLVRWDWGEDTKEYPNLKTAASLIHGTLHGEDEITVLGHTQGFDRNGKKAIEILKSGRVYPTLSGKKVTAFFHNIMRPWSHLKVTIDIWMIRAATLTPLHQDEISKLVRVGYDVVVNALQAIAKQYHMTANAVQAVIWSYIRMMFDENDAKRLARRSAA